MKRALWILLGIALLAATGVILLRAWQDETRTPSPTEKTRRSPAETPSFSDPAHPSEAAAPITPHEAPDIDAPSRAKLEAVLQEHEAEEIRPQSKAKLEALLPSEAETLPSKEKR